ncbi:MAG: hypothetical protein AAF281_01100 [Pseudomonadota bacterium]
MLDRVGLQDPDRLVALRIVHKATEPRDLSGGVFNPEGIRVVGHTVWNGEAFGPYRLSPLGDA